MIGVPEPLSAMHLLWVNLVTDGPPATALSFNPAAPELMKQLPRPSDEPIMSNWLLFRYCLTGLYVGCATVGIFVSHYLSMGVTFSQLCSWSQCDHWSKDATLDCQHLFRGDGRLLPQTLSLTTLVSMEMFKALSAVSLDSSILQIGPHRNIWLLCGVSVPFLLHCLVLYSGKLGMPVLGQSFGMTPLSRSNWVAILQWSTPILVVDEILKLVGRLIKESNRKKKTLNKTIKKE